MNEEELYNNCFHIKSCFYAHTHIQTKLPVQVNIKQVKYLTLTHQVPLFPM